MRNSTAVPPRERLDAPQREAPAETRPVEARAPVAADAGPSERRRRFRRRRSGAASAAAGAAGEGLMLVARIVMWAAGVIALLIALAIVLFDLNANPGNSIAKGVHEGANLFAGAFTGLLSFSGHPKRALSVNWGIAAIVYLLLGAALADLIRLIGRGGLRVEQRARDGV
jgi:hypothetical protein